MPLFNQKVSPGLSVADDTDILHFLNPDNSDKYVDARTALKNSDIYSIVFQLSADLANGKLKADAPRHRGFLITRHKRVMRTLFGNQCLHNCC